MANNKTALAYYTIDTDRYQDRRIKRLKKEFGCNGLAVYDYILCEIYRVRGCFLEWDENTAFDVAEYFGMEEKPVREIILFCGTVGLFNKDLLEKGVITSSSIQRRYKEMCIRARRKQVMIPPAIRLREEDIMSEDPATFLKGIERAATAAAEVPHSLTVDEEIEWLEKDEEWLNELQQLHGLTAPLLLKNLNDFKIQCKADGKEGHDSLQDAKKHFNSWLRIVNNKLNNDTDRPAIKHKRKGNILNVAEEKTYGDSF